MLSLDTFEFFGYAIILCANLHSLPSPFQFYAVILFFLFALSSFSCLILDNCSKNEHSLYIFYLNRSTSSTSMLTDIIIFGLRDTLFKAF